MIVERAVLKLLGLNKATLHPFASQIEEGVAERLENDRKPAPNFSMKGLLGTNGTNTRTHSASVERYKQME
jgi:hypothetical protein